MGSPSQITRRPAGSRVLMALGVICASLAANPARADSLTLIEPLVTAAPGSSGSFEILLANPDTQSYDVASFAFVLSVDPGSGVTFTDVEIPLSNYIFTNSFDALNSLPLSFDIPSTPGTSFTASDSEGSIPQSYTVLNPGDVYGLAQVSYTVDPNATAGPVMLSFDLSNSNWSDNMYPIANVFPLAAQVEGFEVTPEPSTFVMAAMAALGGATIAYRRRSAASRRA